MATPTHVQAPPGRIVAFFAAAFALTWSLQFPAALAKAGVLAGPPERFLPFLGLGLFGPMVAALLVSYGEPGGARGLLARLGDWRVGPGWYLVALLLPGALLTAGLAVHTLVTGVPPERWFWPPLEPERILAFVLFPLSEEIGWRGYALPRLQARFSPLAASGILGVLWTLWHVPMFVVQGIPAQWAPFSVLYFVAGSVSFSWLFHHTRGSLPIAIVAHMGAHLDSSMRTMPEDSLPWLAQGIGYAVLAIVLVAFDRSAWRRTMPSGTASGTASPNG